MEQVQQAAPIVVPPIAQPPVVPLAVPVTPVSQQPINTSVPSLEQPVAGAPTALPAEPTPAIVEDDDFDVLEFIFGFY